MRPVFLFITLTLFLQVISPAQTLPMKLQEALVAWDKDSTLKHALIGFHVVDTKTGKTIFSKNGAIGMAPASTQKILTCVAAYELLGKDFRYRTDWEYSGLLKQGVLDGGLYVKGFGDPTLGSSRFAGWSERVLSQPLFELLKKSGIRTIKGDIVVDMEAFPDKGLPDGWIWEDIGNYYAAPHWAFNWRENSFDLHLKAGDKAGEKVAVIGKPAIAQIKFENLLLTGEKGSGDNAYIHLSPGAREGYLEGTIPAGEKDFVISGAVPNATEVFFQDLQSFIEQLQLNKQGVFRQSCKDSLADQKPRTLLATYYSPPLDSISFHFLHKSINLYGEALLKTIAREKGGTGTTQKGVELLQKFYQPLGIDPYSINIIDGSGLSPQNRVCPEALVKALVYASTRNWFPSFLNALPVYNGLKMKSGSIGGSRAYAGYVTSKEGKEYAFSIIVNNYDGSGGAVIKKMYTLLDLLK